MIEVITLPSIFEAKNKEKRKKNKQQYGIRLVARSNLIYVCR